MPIQLLLYESDPHLRHTMHHALECANLHAINVHDSKELTLEMKRRRVDVAIIDTLLSPTHTGHSDLLQLLAQLRQDSPHTRYILTGTALTLEEILGAGTHSSIKKLTKPFTTAQLIAAANEDGKLARNAPANDTFEQTIARHLRDYFDHHGKESLPPPGLYDRILPLVEKPLLEMTLRATGGNQLKAAFVLGINRNTLRKKIQTLGIKLTHAVDK